jgi:hypothetical protein
MTLLLTLGSLLVFYDPKSGCVGLFRGNGGVDFLLFAALLFLFHRVVFACIHFWRGGSLIFNAYFVRLPPHIFCFVQSYIYHFVSLFTTRVLRRCLRVACVEVWSLLLACLFTYIIKFAAGVRPGISL